MKDNSTIKAIIESAPPCAEPAATVPQQKIKRESPIKLVLIIALCVSLALLACAVAYIQFMPSLSPSNDTEGKIYLTSDSAPWLSFADGVISLNGEYAEALPETLVIPDYFNEQPVTSVAANAFSGKTEIKALKLGESVSLMGEKAFEGCASLESAILPSIEDINAEAFCGCASLKSVTAPKVKVVYSKAFAGCVGLEDFVSNSLISVGASAFEGCQSLTGINTNKITKYGKRAFAGSALTALYVSDGATIGAECFEGSLLTDVSFAGEATLSKGTFKNCTALQKISLPAKATEIPEEAFSGCSGITSLQLPDSVTSLGDGAFSNCTALTTAVISQKIKKMGAGVFEGCSSLSAPEIKAQITALPEKTFKGCSSMSFVSLPDTITKIGDEAFYGCENLQSTNIPFGVTSIGQRAYYGCAALETIALPSGVTDIGENAFESCRAARSIVLPASVSSLGDGALKNCTSLESLGLYCDVDGISGRLVEGCSSLKSVSTSSFSTKYTTFGGVLLSADRTELIIFPAASEDGTYILPSTVTTVAAYAFMGAQFTEARLYNAEMIGMSAFEGCENLISVTGERVSNIGYGAFKNCGKLSDLNFTENLKSVDSEAFAGCESLTEVELFEGVSLSDTAFEEDVKIIYPEEKE